MKYFKVSILVKSKHTPRYGTLPALLVSLHSHSQSLLSPFPQITLILTSNLELSFICHQLCVNSWSHYEDKMLILLKKYLSTSNKRGYPILKEIFKEFQVSFELT